MNPWYKIDYRWKPVFAIGLVLGYLAFIAFIVHTCYKASGGDGVKTAVGLLVAVVAVVLFHWSVGGQDEATETEGEVSMLVFKGQLEPRPGQHPPPYPINPTAQNVANWEAQCAAMARVLGPGGVLLIPRIEKLRKIKIDEITHDVTLRVTVGAGTQQEGHMDIIWRVVLRTFMPSRRERSVRDEEQFLKSIDGTTATFTNIRLRNVSLTDCRLQQGAVRDQLARHLEQQLIRNGTALVDLQALKYDIGDETVDHALAAPAAAALNAQAAVHTAAGARATAAAPGLGQADASREQGIVDSANIRLKGDAEAAAVLAMGQAQVTVREAEIAAFFDRLITDLKFSHAQVVEIFSIEEATSQGPNGKFVKLSIPGLAKMAAMPGFAAMLASAAQLAPNIVAAIRQALAGITPAPAGGGAAAPAAAPAGGAAHQPAHPPAGGGAHPAPAGGGAPPAGGGHHP